ncbi:HDOD domain-containing protein [Methylomonas sp. HYX-M1]|uniref:HDOD domain-containing protein n=1 Tax=Methylomonas sp. HYX-M1 TaxID=3139307 RepID=UPI00345C0D23
MNAASLVKQVDNVFSLPDIVIRVNQLLMAPEPDFAELEATILHDPGLTAAILKMVNSALYSFPSKIDTLSRAISIIGLNDLKAIVIGTSVTQQFKDIASELVNMDIFWNHSVVRAILAKDLAVRLKLGNTERFFIAGLLSCLGKLILYSRFPAESAKVIGSGELDEMALAKAEQAEFGFDYCEVSAELLKVWQLPADIWELIAYQLKPMDCAERQTDACVMHVALAVSSTIQPSVGHEICDIRTRIAAQDFLPGVLERLELSVEEIADVADEAMFQSLDVISILRPQSMSIY